jgi:predicted DNA-binding transcriptional regulator AlpA
MNAITELPDDALIDLEAVTGLVSMRRTWIYDEIRAGRFPAPVKLGTASRWRLGEVRRWLSDLTTSAA